ncbi:hypothetical protein M9H77_02009 [Catharanthus roseus]|uniref:Uncharacterized protein n=1 Tax=Catharanthus roseus TaxID=4058 RepID=A0ACC0C767_CATRO|nr:hypothetical protein M9H77_02009 [Catharanthus roseus]
MAKSWKGATLPLTVGFYQHDLGMHVPTAGRPREGSWFCNVLGGISLFKLFFFQILIKGLICIDALHHVQRMQQALKGLEQQFSCLIKDVKDLKREEEAIFEKSSRRDFGEHPMHDNQWGYGNFSPHARSYEHNCYDGYESNRLGDRDCYNGISCKRIPRNDVRNGGNYVNMDERRSSQTLGTTSRPLSKNNLKLPLFCGTFCPYNYEAWEKKVESLFYSYCESEEKKFQLVLKSLSYEVNVWLDCKCENRRRMRAQPIKTWRLMKKSLRNKFGVGNLERQRQGQEKEKFMESSMGEKSIKANKLS